MTDKNILVPHLPLQCDNPECSCQEQWEKLEDKKIMVYCDTFQSGSHCYLGEDPIRWNVILPISKLTFKAAMEAANKEFKEYQSFKAQRELLN